MTINSTNFSLQQFIGSEDKMLAFGASLARLIDKSATLYISGELGVGKTALCRGILSGRGHYTKVKSPTYTLVEPYDLPSGLVYHFDLYRLSDPFELEHMGYRDYLDNNALILVEWPEKGLGWLPKPDLSIQITDCKQGRNIACQGESKLGLNIIDKL